MSLKVGFLFLLFCSLAFAIRHRIINGDPASVKPFQMYVQAFNATGDNLDYGAGVVIAPKAVLTVGSLIKGFESWTLRYGSNIFGQLSTILSTVAFVHPNYRLGDQVNMNDVGMIILPTPITGIPNVSPISLPITEVVLPRPFDEGQITNFETILAEGRFGFSNNSTLHSAFLTVYPLAECAQTFPNITAGMFCAFDEHYLSNLCTGDRGTAFVVVFRGVETLAGITSRVSAGCNDRSTFLQIQPYIAWISAIANL